MHACLPPCSAIPLPPSSYPLFDAYPEAVVQAGKLSQLQLEGVLYACSRHQQILPSGERAGFFIGRPLSCSSTLGVGVGDGGWGMGDRNLMDWGPVCAAAPSRL